MSWLIPGSAAMFSLMYALFGALVAYAATLVVGVPAYLVLRKMERPMLPRFIAISLVTALAAATVVQCLFTNGKCEAPSIQNATFAVVSALVTAILIVRVSKEANAL